MGKPYTTQEFIDKVNIIHNNRYDYSKTRYTLNKLNVIIICNIHGEFTKIAGNHIRGQGCPKCSNEQSGKRRRISTKKFIQRANKVHNNKYKYSITNINTNSLSGNYIEIICPIHGIFTQQRYKHLEGKGCSKCSNIKRRNTLLMTTEDFIRKAIVVHGDKYSYKNVIYTGRATKVSISCRQHGDFKQNPNNHLTGSGCPQCSLTGFNPMKKAILYYVSINYGQYYKIGITNSTVKNRFIGDTQNIKEIKTWEYEVGIDAKHAESKILKQFKYARHKGQDKPLHNGNTELFTHDILLLDS